MEEGIKTMAKNTGLSLHLYTTKEELDNAKNGVSTIVGWTKEQKQTSAVYHISVSADICDVLEKEVRINISKVEEQLLTASAGIGEAMGKELEKVFKQFA